MNAGENKTGQGYIPGEAFDALLHEELAHLRRRHGKLDASNLRGLAFSGGGIRSSTFALGLTQALARMGWLERMHYLSTVSGGGYIGSSLTWLWHKAWDMPGSGNAIQFDAGKDFPYRKYYGLGKSQEDCARPRAMLRHLRQHSNYLTPGHGISGASLAAVMLRGLLMSMLMFLIPLLFMHYGLIEIRRQWGGDAYCLFLLAGGAGFAVFALLSLAYALGTGFQRNKAQAYRWRRCFEKCGAKLLVVSMAMSLFGAIPWLSSWLTQSVLTPTQAASGSALGGLFGAVFSAVRANAGKMEGRLLSVLAPVALALLVFSILLGLYLLAGWFLACGVGWPWLVGLLALSLLVGHFSNINYLSIHRYYRDRLMELFMPDVGRALAGKSVAVAEEANATCLSEMTSEKKTPYHLINANMVTINSEQAKLHARGGENFILSPLFCGSEATGWRRTEDFMKGNMNLATAMAISGAAADPHGAPGGEGLLKNRSLALLMALLNVRLGYWAPNPAPNRSPRRHYPNGHLQGLKELLGFGMNEASRFVHLADGGHFENLALYELIRRRVRAIIVTDGAADAGYSFADFANFIEKARVDFGVDVEMDKSFLAMCPKPERDEYGNLRNPYAVDTAEKGYVTGKIIYNDGSEGLLVYVKTTLIPGLPKDIYGYKSAHPEFPDETTADQFFDEKQFEAYRELGYRIGKSLGKDKKIQAYFES